METATAQRGGARPGAGRKPAAEPRNRYMQFKVNAAEKLEIENRAYAAGVTISAYIRERALA